MSEVIRLSPRAAFLLNRMAQSANARPSAFLSQLVVDYAKGLSFEDDPDLDMLPAPPADVQIR